MAGIATGLALARLRALPLLDRHASARCAATSSSATAPILHGLPVRVVGIGGGFAYGHAGPTHYALEDLAIMRDPARHDGARSRRPGPDAGDRARRHGPSGAGLPARGQGRQPGGAGPRRPLRLRTAGGGAGAAARSCSSPAGPIVHEASPRPSGSSAPGVRRGRRPRPSRSRGGPRSSSTCWPRYRHVVTVEDGYTTGGLASLVAETIAQPRPRLPPRSCAAWPAPLTGASGGEAFMRAAHGLDGAALAEADPSPARGPGLSGPLLSVVLPCRNQADHIARVLESYAAPLAALAGGYELVVVPERLHGRDARGSSRISRPATPMSVRCPSRSAAGVAPCSPASPPRAASGCATPTPRGPIPRTSRPCSSWPGARGEAVAKVRRERRGAPLREIGLLALQPGGPPALRHPRPRRERHAEDPAPDALRAPRPPLAGRPPGPGAAGARQAAEASPSSSCRWPASSATADARAPAFGARGGCTWEPWRSAAGSAGGR